MFSLSCKIAAIISLWRHFTTLENRLYLKLNKANVRSAVKKYIFDF